MWKSTFLALALAFGTAHAGDKGVTPTEIRIGTSAVLSGPLGPQTVEYTVGSRLYFDAVNAAGGVHGRKIVYTTLDDGFDVKRAVENTRITQGSGYEQLDRVAEQVMREVAQFTPALNRDQRVPVWIQIPVTFQTR